MSKFVIISTAALILLLWFIFAAYKQPIPKPYSGEKNFVMQATESSSIQSADIQASFAIFTNGTFRIFTAPMYHNLSRDIYIEASNPNKVFVKKTGATWHDFFLTLPFKLTSDCLTTGTRETYCSGSNGTLKFFINGEQDTNALNREIKNDDKLLVTFGSEPKEVIKEQQEIL